MKAIDTWHFLGRTFIKFDIVPSNYRQFTVDNNKYVAELVYNSPQCLSVEGEYDFKDKNIVFE